MSLLSVIRSILLTFIICTPILAQSRMGAHQARGSESRVNKTSVIIKSTIKSTIYIDGIIAGESGEAINLVKPTIALIKAPGYHSKKIRIQPRRGKTTTFQIKMRKKARKVVRTRQAQGSKLTKKEILKQRKRSQADDMFEDQEPMYRQTTSKSQRRMTKNKQTKDKDLFADIEPEYHRGKKAKKNRRQRRINKNRDYDGDRMLAEFQRDGLKSERHSRRSQRQSRPSSFRDNNQRMDITSPEMASYPGSHPAYMVNPYPHQNHSVPLYSPPIHQTAPNQQWQKRHRQPQEARRTYDDRNREANRGSIGIAPPPPVYYFK